MRIGCPRERKTGERRVAITPTGAAKLVSGGHKVLMETCAGVLSGFVDAEYQAVGAEIVPTLESVWKNCEILVKVKEPAPEEYHYFRPGLIVFSFLHPVAFPEMVNALVRANVTSLSYDLLENEAGRLVLLEPMSVIAGKLAVQCGAHALQAENGGSGVLLGGCGAVAPANVIVLGAGASGASAVQVAHGMGANVSVFDINPGAEQRFKNLTTRFQFFLSSSEVLAAELPGADLVIGAVLIPGAPAPKVLTREMLSTMKPGSVFVDISIDQGGCAETSRATSLSSPTYVEHGVIHYCVPNMPALVPRTATMALTAETLPYVLLLANSGFNGTLNSKPLTSSLVTHNGEIVNPTVASELSPIAVGNRI